MFDLGSSTQVYLACGSTDLRKSFFSLAAIVKIKFRLDPYSKCMFVFCNNNRNLVKCLQWDGNGFWLIMKKLSNGKFEWPQNNPEVKTVSGKELRYLLEGLGLDQKSTFKDSHPTVII